MSFIPFEKKDLPKELKNISNTFIRCNTNILRQITIGHESFYKKIKLSIKDNKGKVTIIKPESDPSTHFLQLHLLEQQQQSVSTSIKNEDIKFTNYLFDNRYQFNTLLTYGGFSQIILVNDYFSQDKQMVLKVLKSGYHSMGVREQVILRHLTVHQTKGPQYFVTIRDIFQLSSHCCLVMNHMHSTLLDFICRPVSAATTVTDEVVGGESGGLTDLNLGMSGGRSDHLTRPRPIRPSVGSSKHHIRSSRSSSTSNHIDSDNISTKRGSSIAARPIHFDELTLNKFKKIAMSMISALCILRHEGIIHGDIKLENVFINSKDHPSSSCSSINANGNGNGNGLSSSSSTVNATASGKNTIKLNHDDSQYQQQSESSHNIHHQTHTTSNSSSSSSISNSHKRSRVLSDQYDSAISESKSGLAFSSPSNHNTKPISSPTTGYTAPSSSSSSSSYIPTEQYTHSHTSTLSWVPSKHSLSDLPTDFEVLLGDFGNAIHISEASQYHTDFELQSLPYRAPEVLIGHPFSTQIDMWSVGVALVELCSGQPLFVATSREELCAQIGELIAPWPQQRFAGGRYSSILRSHVSASSSQSSAQSPMVSTIVSAATTTATTSHDSASKSQYQSSPVNLSIAPSLSSSSQVASSLVSSFTLPSPSHHLVCIRKLFDQFGVQNVTDDMVDFIGELLQLHPDNRMTPYDALQHPFLLNSQSYQVPISLFHLEYLYGSQVQSQSNLQFVAKKKENAALVSLGRLRKSFSSKR